MKKFLENHKKKFIIASMVLCVAAMVITVNPAWRPTFLTRGFHAVMRPLQRGATGAANWVGTRLSMLWEMGTLQRDNDLLRTENGHLLQQIELLQQAREENDRLTEMLHVRQLFPEWPMAGATVIAKDLNDWHFGFTIDRGSNDGIERNMAVVDAGGLIGIVREVFPNTAHVTGVLDDRFSAAVMGRRTGDTGILHGDVGLMPRGLMRMDNVSVGAHLLPGDRLVTGTLSALFPAGIIVGYVESIHTHAAGLSQYAFVRPAAHTGNLRNVMVITMLFDQAAPGDSPGMP